MKKILVAVLFAAAPAFAAQNQGPAKVEEAIKALLAQIDTCIANKDATCLGESFTNDVTFTSPALVDAMNVPKIYKGKAAVIKAFEGLMKDQPMKMKHLVQNVHVINADRVFVDTSVDLSGMKMKSPGNYYFVGSVVRENGKWLIEDMRSYSVIFPTPFVSRPPEPTAQSVTPAQSAMPAPPVTPKPPAEPAKQ